MNKVRRGTRALLGQTAGAGGWGSAAPRPRLGHVGVEEERAAVALGVRDAGLGDVDGHAQLRHRHNTLLGPSHLVTLAGSIALYGAGPHSRRRRAV